jgi:hypothetical protein
MSCRGLDYLFIHLAVRSSVGMGEQQLMLRDASGCILPIVLRGQRTGWATTPQTQLE